MLRRVRKEALCLVSVRASLVSRFLTGRNRHTLDERGAVSLSWSEMYGSAGCRRIWRCRSDFRVVATFKQWPCPCRFAAAGWETPSLIALWRPLLSSCGLECRCSLRWREDPTLWPRPALECTRPQLEVPPRRVLRRRSTIAATVQLEKQQNLEVQIHGQCYTPTEAPPQPPPDLG